MLFTLLSTSALAANEGPVITQQPENCILTSNDDAAQFSIQATGSPSPTYQWQIDASTGWRDIPGAVHSTYTLDKKAMPEDMQLFRCQVTSGGITVDSYPVYLMCRWDDNSPHLYFGSNTYGMVTVSTLFPAVGETVTVTAIPDEGYKPDVLWMLGDVIPTKTGNTYTFAMPADSVRIDVIFIPVDQPSYPFMDDCPSGWAKGAIQYLNAAGIMKGTSSNAFSPTSPMTRAMLATVLYRMDGEPAVTNPATPFTDVAADTWYSNAVAWARETGLITGTSPTTFSPNDHVTREQLAAMLWRYAGKPAPKNPALHFSDQADVAGYAREAMAWAVETGVITGSNDTLRPKKNAAREQVAAILWRYLGAPTPPVDQ